MASSTHVDSRVAERRLRPIYDWLDFGNNKKALQEAEKVLKKQPNLLCAKVLKALALQRLGKNVECEEILGNVCGEVPSDEATLQAISICYRAIHKPEKICEVYCAALKKDPANEELLTHVFMSFVRVGDYKKQHQYAMSLYKLRPKNPYYFWGVMSVAMQAKGDPNLKDSLALRLAEKMVSKFVSDGKIEAEQEVQLYLMILEMQEKYEEALDVIEGVLGEKLKSLVTTSSKRVELLIKLARWKEANVLLKAQLKNNPDNWSDHVNYLMTTMNLYELHGSDHVADDVANSQDQYRVPLAHENGECIVWGEADHLPSHANTFLVALAEEGREKRGPPLARLELYRLLHLRPDHDPKTVVGDLTPLLAEYFEMFGSKAICVADVRPYLHLLTVDEASVLMKRISDFVGLADGQSPTSMTSLQQHISRFQLSRILGFQKSLTVDERLGLSKLLVSHYHSAQQFVDPDKLPTEFSCNDPYIILVSHILHSVFLDTRAPVHLLRGIHHLENALTRSPSNFFFKILLVKFYLLLGAGQQALTYYDQLEAKHVQLDSLGYLVCTSLYGLGHVVAGAALFDTSLKFFTSTTNDSQDHLTYAYKFGSFTKIDEFVQFRDRINDSLHYRFCTVEKMLHDLLFASEWSQVEQIARSMDVRAETGKIDWSRLQDNRDLTVLLSYEPNAGPQLSQALVRKTFDVTRHYVRLRVGLLKCVAAALELPAEQSVTECVQNGGVECLRTNLTACVEELRALYDEVSAQDTHVEELINTPPPCRLNNYLRTPMWVLVSEMATILTNTEDDNSTTANSVCLNVRAVTETLRAQVQGVDLASRKDVLETTISVAEMLAVAAVLCGCAQKMTHRGKGGRRGRRKKDEAEAEGKARAASHTVLAEVTACIKDVDAVLGDVVDASPVNTVSSEVKALNLEDEVVDLSCVEGKCNESYFHAIRGIRLFLQQKLHFINQLCR